jgi:hypothetical protein
MRSKVGDSQLGSGGVFHETTGKPPAGPARNAICKGIFDYARTQEKKGQNGLIEKSLET